MYPIVWKAKSDLEALVFQIRSTLLEEVVSYILSEIAIYVREMLLAQDALLLHDIYEMFQNKVDKDTSVCNIPVGMSQITTNMLRNNLSLILEPLPLLRQKIWNSHISSWW